MCTVGMDNFIINKPMHKSSLSITETNWFSWDIYLRCSTILAWLSQAEKHGNHRLKSSNHKNHRQKTVKLSAKGTSQKTGRAAAGLTVSCFTLFCGLLVLSLVCSGWGWGGAGLKKGSRHIFLKIFCSTCRSEYIYGQVCFRPPETVSFQQFLLWWVSSLGDRTTSQARMQFYCERVKAQPSAYKRQLPGQDQSGLGRTRVRGPQNLQAYEVLLQGFI